MNEENQNQDTSKTIQGDNNTFQPPIASQPGIGGSNQIQVPSHRLLKPKQKRLKKVLLTVLLVILLISTSAAGAYFYRSKKADEFEAKQNNSMTKLSSENTNLASQLANEKSKNATSQMAFESVAPSEATIEKIKTAVTSGNTVALEGYMAESVNVIVGGSGSNAVKTITPALAATSITSFVSDATSPWDFPPSASVIRTLNGSGWTHYIPNNAVIGESANKKVVSLSFNSKSEICSVILVAFKSSSDFN